MLFLFSLSFSLSYVVIVFYLDICFSAGSQSFQSLYEHCCTGVLDIQCKHYRDTDRMRERESEIERLTERQTEREGSGLFFSLSLSISELIQCYSECRHLQKFQCSFS